MVETHMLPRSKMCFIVFAISFLIVFFPIFGAISSAFILANLFNKKYAGFFAGSGLFVLFFVLNSNKEIYGDWLWYVSHYIYLKDLSLIDYLGEEIYGVTARSTEPVYHFVSSVTSKISGANISALSFIVTALIYFNVSYAAGCLNKHFCVSADKVFLVVCSVVLLGVTFTLTTHLVRQEIAIAFAFVVAVNLLTGSLISAVLLSLVSVGTHSSVIVILTVVWVVWWSLKFSFAKRTLLLIAFSVALLFVGSFLVEGGAGHSFDGKDDGSIGLITYAFDLLIFVGVLFIGYIFGYARYLIQFYLLVILLYSIFVSSLVGQPLAFLRFYFYFELCRLIGVSIISYSLAKKYNGYLGLLSLIVLGCLYLSFRIHRAPFDYGGDLLFYFSRNIFYFI